VTNPRNYHFKVLLKAQNVNYFLQVGRDRFSSMQSYRKAPGQLQTFVASLEIFSHPQRLCLMKLSPEWIEHL
jgi:hypothetical protein